MKFALPVAKMAEALDLLSEAFLRGIGFAAGATMGFFLVLRFFGVLG